MFSNNLNQIDLVDPIIEVEPILELNQIAYDFRREIQYRTAFQQECEQYYALAKRHQNELAQMRREINLFSWFCRLV